MATALELVQHKHRHLDFGYAKVFLNSDCGKFYTCLVTGKIWVWFIKDDRNLRRRNFGQQKR